MAPSSREIYTSRLRLRAFTLADYEAAAQGDDVLAARLRCPVLPQWLEFPEALDYWIQELRRDPAAESWMMYGFFAATDGSLLGGGGFKGAPSADGTVEIGYGIAPVARKQGIATEAAQALCKHAFSFEEITRVLAHTEAVENASVGVLRRLGFERNGTATDPDVGEVWRWQLLRPTE